MIESEMENWGCLHCRGFIKLSQCWRDCCSTRESLSSVPNSSTRPRRQGGVQYVRTKSGMSKSPQTTLLRRCVFLRCCTVPTQALPIENKNKKRAGLLSFIFQRPPTISPKITLMASSTSSLPVGQSPTTLKSNPPFRHEHVGSFLRPKAVHDARAQFAAGKLNAVELRKIEDEEIKKHIDRCIHWKVRDLTDAEFRRQYFHIDFLQHIAGVEVQKNCECSYTITSVSLVCISISRLTPLFSPQHSSRRRATFPLPWPSLQSSCTQRILK